jgi:hypothetical protein
MLELTIPQDLLECLYHFFPVGLPNLPNYAGVNEIRKIVNKKIDEDCNNERSDINELFSDLMLQIPGLKWENISYRQYPNYIINSLLKDELANGINHTCNLQITISLLCNYYTIFFL